ncbi:MAG: hypothetical protein MK135_00360, partial [Polyangiaceae bacterium]|nr:hypothetical protein [Polyangiaceae bacterium]
MLKTVLTFALGKGAVFFVPLLASVVVSSVHYGHLEFALALGAPFAATFSLGLPSSYAFFELKQNQPEYTPVIQTLFSLVVAMTLLLGLGSCVKASMMSRFTFGFFVAAALIAQSGRSSYLKMSAQPARAALLDGGIYYCILAALIAVLVGKGEEHFVTFACIALVCWALSLSAKSFARLTSLRGQRRVIREILRYGSSVFLAGAVTSTAANTAKLAAGRFLG